VGSDKGITLAAITSAKKLGIPLVRSFKKNEAIENQCPYWLEVIHSPAPFEYFDGLPPGTKIREHVHPEIGKNIFLVSGSKFKLLYDPTDPYQIQV
jgi:hypothetical protein